MKNLLLQTGRVALPLRVVAAVCALVLVMVCCLQTAHVCGELASSALPGTQASTGAHDAHCFLCHVPHAGRVALVTVSWAPPRNTPLLIIAAANDGKDIELPFPLFVRPPPAA